MKRQSTSKIRFGSQVEKFKFQYLISSPENEEEREITLSAFFERRELWEFLFQTNTFFHAKIGFYEPILFSLLEKGKPQYRYKIIHTSKNLSQNIHHDYLVLLPFSSSQNELNSLISKAFSVGLPIWVVAPFPLALSSLLINFQNFFLHFHKQEEFDSMLNLFSFQDIALLDWLKEKSRNWIESEGISLFITNLFLGKAAERKGNLPPLMVKEMVF